MENSIIKLSRIVECLEMVNVIIDYYYNPATGEIVSSDIGKNKDEIFEKSIILPTQYEMNEYKIICDFIETLEDKNIKDSLSRLIHGKGAFKRFKDYCFYKNIIQEWYTYKNKRYREIAINWCRKNDIKYIEE